MIVDELHAVAGSKRGAHLMLTLERLEALCERPPVRIGLSATVKPLDEMARFLVGQRDADAVDRSSTPAMCANATSRSRCRARR